MTPDVQELFWHRTEFTLVCVMVLSFYAPVCAGWEGVRTIPFTPFSLL